MTDLPDLQFSQPITNEDGTPSPYFLRYLLDRKGFLTEQESILSELLLRQIIAGVGLTGGGTLEADITIDLEDTAVTPGSYTNTDLTVDAQGRITAAANGSSASGTVTSVDLAVPTGFGVSGNPITTSGTITIAFSAGYSLPTNASQTNWNTAFGWGNHASAGYLDSGDIGVSVQAYDVDLAGLAGLSFSNGDIIYYNSGLQRLAKGSDDDVLTLASGLPSWAAASGGSGTSKFPVVDGSTPPNLVYEEDGSLVYVEI